MMKRNTPESSKNVKSPLNTGSSGKKSAIQELLTSRGTSAFEDGVISAMFGISLALGSISRSQEVLLDRIESIALKVEILSKEVTSLQNPPPPPFEFPVMNSHESFPLPSDKEIEDWLNTPISSPERGTFPDITCYEML